MMFARISLSHATGAVVGVLCQDLPFSVGGVDIQGSESQQSDLGVITDRNWVDLDGRACSPSRYVMARLGVSVHDALAFEPGAALAAHGIEGVLDCPCSLAGIRTQLRERGIDGIPVLVRAWLTLVLPDHLVRELAIWQRVPLSALAAMERVRNRRDPGSGSRIAQIERQIQSESDQRSARALRRRHDHEVAAAESAWAEMRAAIQAQEAPRG